MNWLKRRFLEWRLNTPEVHDMLNAQGRMLDDWSETPLDSPDRRALWTQLHRAGERLGEAVGR